MAAHLRRRLLSLTRSRTFTSCGAARRGEEVTPSPRSSAASVTRARRPATHGAAPPASISRSSDHGALIDAAKSHVHLPRREQFELALKQFMEREKYRRGHVAFIALALERMREFGLEKDLLTYNRLLDLFPKGRFVPRRMLDALWPRPLPQMELALDLLTRMEEEGVRPDYTTFSLLREVFGKTSFPVDKCLRLAYWFDRFEHSDPYWVEGGLPSNGLELARLALRRMVGREGKLEEHQLPSEDNPSFLLSAQTREQSSLLAGVGGAATLEVEGPRTLWMLSSRQMYFQLRLVQQREEAGEEGPVLGVCTAVPASRAALSQWLAALQKLHPPLASATILFSTSELAPPPASLPPPHTKHLESQ